MPGKQSYGKAGNHILSYATIVMMWPMIYYEHTVLLSYSIRQKKMCPMTGTMPYLAHPFRSINFQLFRCTCTRCRGANWRQRRSTSLSRPILWEPHRRGENSASVPEPEVTMPGL